MRLTDYDSILVSSSAGKDSLVMLDVLADQARAEGCLERLTVVHCDLGRVEWPGTPELAERQAQRYGLRFLRVSRPQGDLLEQVEKRGMWPDSANRYCTSDHKRGQVAKVVTMIAGELHDGPRRIVRPRILNCLGFRRQESASRNAKPTSATNGRLTNGKREVVDFHPILEWSEDEVWTHIRSRGLEYHPAYDLGMPRLSCAFCIFAGRDALLVAGHANPELLREYAAVEKRVGHQFRGNPDKPRKGDVNLGELRDAVEAGERPSGKIAGWTM